MERAVVCIGVRRSGSLPILRGVLPAVESMRNWALAQGIEPARVRVLTDEHGPLSAQSIKDTVRELVELAVLEQLIVYFAGHGVNNRMNEYWLLTDAPVDPQAAVSLSGSVDLARFAGIPHVVFISDACRTAPEAITAQYVSGSDVFPNTPPSGVEADVDIFFATTLGRPAHEARDPRLSASSYTALYTEALVEALTGHRAEVVDLEGTPPCGFVRPRALKKCLMRPLSAPVGATNRSLGQVPDARITSGDDAWLSRLTAPPAADTPATPAPTAPSVVTASVAGERDAADVLLDAFLHPERRFAVDPLFLLRRAKGAGLEVLDRARALSAPLGPARFATDCGFIVRGSRCLRVESARFRTELLTTADPGLSSTGAPAPGQLVGVEVPPWTDVAVDGVLLTFAEGTCALLPAIPEFLATVTVEDGLVVDVSYEPSPASSRWHRYDERAEELRDLRAAVSTAAYLGAFHPEGDDLDVLARRMQVAKGIDPTMALYAAYAYRAAGRRPAIEEMGLLFRRDLHFEFFDVMMLRRSPRDGAREIASAAVVPPFPLLSQGWALMRTHALDAPDRIRALEGHLRQSLWTTFDGAGHDLVVELMKGKAWT